MPFKSDQQRRLFFAARNDPDLRKQLGMSRTDIERFIRDDERSRASRRRQANRKRASRRS